jgi:hypothetical protein
LPVQEPLAAVCVYVEINSAFVCSGATGCLRGDQFCVCVFRSHWLQSASTWRSILRLFVQEPLAAYVEINFAFVCSGAIDCSPRLRGDQFCVCLFRSCWPQSASTRRSILRFSVQEPLAAVFVYVDINSAFVCSGATDHSPRLRGDQFCVCLFRSRWPQSASTWRSILHLSVQEPLAAVRVYAKIISAFFCSGAAGCSLRLCGY